MGLRRTLGLRHGVMLVVGNVVGAGIFTTSGFLAENVSRPGTFIGIWLLGGVITLFGALTYAELGAMYPRAGGDYQILKEAYGPWAGFLLGWLSFWVITPGSTAALAIALVDYIPGFPAGSLAREFAAVGIIAAVVGVNFVGTKRAGLVQNVTTALGVVALVALIAVGFATGGGDWSNYRGATTEVAGSTGGWGAAFIAVIFTYSGWFAAAYLGGELRNPGRTVPLSLALGTAIVMALYAAVNAFYLYALPLDEMAGEKNTALLAADRIFGDAGAVPVSLVIVVAIASCINANVMAGARICFAMARDGLFFRGLGKIHPRFGTPHVAVISQGVIAAVLVFAGTFEQLLSWVVMAMLLSSVFSAVSLYVLRFRKPGTERPYRVTGYPVVPALFVAAYVWIAGSIAADRPELAISGLILSGSGLPFYWIWARKRRRSQ